MFALTCPKCGEADSVRLNLSDLELFECVQCSDEITREEIDDLIREWSAVLKWIDTAGQFATSADEKPATLAG